MGVYIVNMKTFILSFIVLYLMISLPVMLGFGYVIDWDPEATVLQKFNGYVIEGLTNNYLMKIIISLVVGAFVSLFLAKRKATLKVK